MKPAALEALRPHREDVSLGMARTRRCAHGERVPHEDAPIGGRAPALSKVRRDRATHFKWQRQIACAAGLPRAHPQRPRSSVEIIEREVRDFARAKSESDQAERA